MYYYWKLQDSKAYEAGLKSKSIQVHVGPKDHGWPQAEKVKIFHGDSKLFGPSDPNHWICMWGNSNDFPWDFLVRGKIIQQGLG